MAAAVRPGPVVARVARLIDLLAHTTALAAARQRVLADAGWDVERDGLSGAPSIGIVVGEERHVSLDRALRLLGLGTASLEPVAVDDRGAMRADALADRLRTAQRPLIVCAQAGNVNTGAVDPLDAICDVAHAAGAWVHVDGAFGMWAGASPRHRALLRGCARADSWATDAHEWLNVPYDCGLAFVADRDAHRRAMWVSASYLSQGGPVRDPLDWTPEFSRRARSLPVYARCARSAAPASRSWSIDSAPAPSASQRSSAKARAG